MSYMAAWIVTHIATPVKLILVGFLIYISISLHLEPFLLRYRPILETKICEGCEGSEASTEQGYQYGEDKIVIYERK